MDETPTKTLKIITPSPETKNDGSKLTDPRVREVPKETVSYSSAKESEFVLDYKLKTGRPYIADMLDSRFLYDQKICKDEMDTVDEWVNFEILRRGLNGKKESYRAIVNELSKKLEIHKYASAEDKVKKLSTLLKKAVEDNRYYSKIGIDLKSLETIYGNVHTT